MPDLPELHPGDCRDTMAALAMIGEQFHAVVCDPPYHLTSVVKRFGSTTAAPAQHGADGAFARKSRGFMGARWDGGDIAFQPDTWRAAWELLPPGGYLAAFGGTRTHHRMVCAIEDAGFDIRDTLMWVYGTGKPDARTLPKMVAAIGADPAGWEGRGIALKPSWEPITLAQKPVESSIARNALAHGAGWLNISACGVPVDSPRPLVVSQSGGSLNTYGNGLNGSRGAGETLANRWPANLLHDGSAEVLNAFAAYGQRGASAPASGPTLRNGSTSVARGRFNGLPEDQAPAFHGDTGTAARFFYCAKATKADRAGSRHPTVKPLALMEWLCRLITPPGGRVLDPFAGSGTTLQAAYQAGFAAVGCEAEPEYCDDIRRRIASISRVHTVAQEDTLAEFFS